MTSRGVDCVWLAADRDGAIGAFVTGGSGPVPLDVLEPERLPIDEIEALISEMPRISQARMLVALKRPDDFIDMAERGLFVYDWTDVHRTASEEIGAYELISVPITPVNVTGISAHIRDILSRSRPNVSFSAAKNVDIRQQINCCEPD